ncbi:helix-turn-helix domain-containing protein [Clostridium sp. AN503]|uniref:ArsR/SmtB family transcription factor n=1 Tax=Clostridium sp. AN503 TaxID=3160598 RepID=UPI0034577C15
MSEKEKKPVRIIGERNISLHLSNQEHHERICQIGKAISSPARLQILGLLKNAVMSVQELADTLHIPISSAALHIKNLEEAGLIITETQPGKHGSMRVCTCSMQSFFLQNSDTDADSASNSIFMDMPVGNYYQWDIQPTCGLADENGIIDGYDDVRTFYSPARGRAQLLWFHSGYIEYRFPNIGNPLLSPSEISFQMEICSEAPGYLEHWPSDITISINGHEVGTYCSPGDYGARRGNLTPLCWPNGRTQYGILKTFSVREHGGYIDGALVNQQLGLKQLKLNEQQYISLRIQIKETAHNIGGINLFGEKYGDYPQGIVMSLVY